jgi:DNA end-binding protein Ku
VLSTLRYAYEIRPPDALDLPAAGRGADKRELALARQLIDTLATDWDPTRYRDTYRDVLLKVIEQKAKGEPISVPAPRKPARVVSLMDALQQSLKAPRRAPAKAVGRRRAAHPARKRAA